MKAIKVPKQDRKFFLEAARITGFEMTRLNKILHPCFDYFNAGKMNASQNDFFELGVCYHKLKSLQHNHFT
ncbi:MAG: hypothetical protein M3Z26_00335 [Bacteroidota bacterium]|nr:hypothetical protein [Bacteroidota bacterium]